MYPCRLISAFAINLIDSIIYKLATSEILIFYLASIAEQIGLGMTWSKNPEDRYMYSLEDVQIESG